MRAGWYGLSGAAASTPSQIPQSDITGGNWWTIPGTNIGIDYPTCWGPDWWAGCLATQGAYSLMRMNDAQTAVVEGASEARIAASQKDVAESQQQEAQAQEGTARSQLQTSVWQMLPVVGVLAVVGLGIGGYLLYRSSKQRDEALMALSASQEP